MIRELAAIAVYGAMFFTVLLIAAAVSERHEEEYRRRIRKIRRAEEWTKYAQIMRHKIEIERFLQSGEYLTMQKKAPIRKVVGLFTGPEAQKFIENRR